MKIQIPKEYCKNFENMAYITFWGKNTLLVMNKAEMDEYKAILEQSKVCIGDGTTRLFKAGIVEVDFDNDAIYIPEGLNNYLSGEKRSFERNEIGLVIS